MPPEQTHQPVGDQTRRRFTFNSPYLAIAVIWVAAAFVTVGLAWSPAADRMSGFSLVFWPLLFATIGSGAVASR